MTKRQKEGFGAIIDGNDSMKIKYNAQGLVFTKGPIKIRKDKIFKISDAGTDMIDNVTINKIITVK